MFMTKQGVGFGGVLVVALGSAAGCGTGFSGDDCMETHTCKPSNDGGAGGNGAGEMAGASSQAEPDAGGADAAGGNGGEGPAPDCGSAADCDDGNAMNGAEQCSALGACEDGNPPPTVMSVSPENEAGDVDPDVKVVITFSEPLDETTIDSNSVQILDGDVPVQGELSYSFTQAIFTPTNPLTLLAPYKVKVSSAIRDVAGAALHDAFSSTFSVRDGAWQTADAVSTGFPRIAGTLPMTSFGEVLLAWSAPSARLFRRGVALDKVTPLGDTEMILVAGNAHGVLAASWFGADGTYVAQHRDGSWIMPSRNITSDIGWHIHPGLVVAPDGSVTLFENDLPGTTVRRLASSGAGSAPFDVISTDDMLSPPATAFDATGNGVALWRSEDAKGGDRIVFSRYTASEGTWSEAAMLPDGVSDGPSDFGRGAAPAVAMDREGNAAALWLEQVQSQPSVSVLMASHFSPDGGWSKPKAITAAVPLPIAAINDAPALVFDGKTFVAAFTGGVDDNQRFAYSLRYDAVAGGWTYEKRQAAADAKSSRRMPRLLSDSHGNLILIWVTGATPTYTLVYQRYSNGVWSTTQSLPGGSIADSQMETGFDANPPPPLPASMNETGMGVVGWTNFGNSHEPTAIRLASFF